MEHAINKPFELIIDLSAFGPANEVQNQWIAQFLQVLPFDIENNLSVIYIHNVNNAFKRYLKKIGRNFNAKLAKKIVFTTSLTELYERIAPSELRLPKWTGNFFCCFRQNFLIASLEMGAGSTFSPVTKISQFKLPIPVTLKVCNEVILVTTVRQRFLIFT